jgi:endonuclease YncB( thermonuclease family)
METLAFLLLIAALALFVLSTQQWKLPIRGAVWAGGLAAIVIASVMVASDNHGGLFRAFADFFANIGSPGDSVLAKSFARNGSQIARFVLPLLDLFLILGALVGLLSLIAFTPGEKLDKALRPIGVGLIGAIFGGVLALAIVGTGFGDVSQQQVYSTYLRSSAVEDGDTLWMGEVPVRLAGIDAPESDQICRQGDRRISCGVEARRKLQTMVEGALVVCVAEEGGRRSQGTYSLPLVRCEATKGDSTVDLAESMALEGYAVAFGDGRTSYRREAALAAQNLRGLMNSCSLRPDVWRANARKVQNFTDRNRYEMADTMGNCPVRGQQGQGRDEAPPAPP